jgi:fucokinase
LGAGLIATLARMMGADIPRAELYARTSNLEQLMTTGGGWQDQIGGVAGGVKIITTTAGYDQTPQLAWTQLAPPGLAIDDHFLLYYTGIRRMAKNLLRQVVGRYLKKEAEALATLDELGSLARAMKEDLDKRRLAAFGEKIRRAWALNKTLDAGQTTTEIEAVLTRIDDYMIGAKLLGAGGGGFLFIVAKDKAAAVRIRRELTENPPNDRARFFRFDVDAGGMRTSVL